MVYIHQLLPHLYFVQVFSKWLALPTAVSTSTQEKTRMLCNNTC